MTHNWLVTWKHPSGSIKEPDGIVCTQCGLQAMRWFESFIFKVTDVVRALTHRIESKDIPKVRPECAGGGNAG